MKKKEEADSSLYSVLGSKEGASTDEAELSHRAVLLQREGTASARSFWGPETQRRLKSQENHIRKEAF